MKVYKNPDRKDWPELLRRPQTDFADIDRKVQEILQDVRNGGDQALMEFNEKLDGWKGKDFWVPEDLMKASAKQIDPHLKSAIETARNNIEKFHCSQVEPVSDIETSPGIRCWRKSVPIERVGLYIPGGTAPLFSTLLMLAIPASIAGCKEIVVCSPAKSNFVHPAMLYTAYLLGIRNFFKIGGAQAVAAMAYGTETIKPVNKIFGPGNRFVTRAKEIVNSEGVAIDMPAGPSEVAVFADEHANPEFVAADLLSQAEHGMDSQVILVSCSEAIGVKVMKAMEVQMQQLDRKKEMESSIAHSRCFIMENEKDSFDLLNAYAPEHLIIASDRASTLSELVVNAGSVFLGHYAPESAGDYISGTNHTLPTNGYAKTYSGVSIDSFVKKITFQEITAAGIAGVANAIGTLAAAEGLQAHRNAALIRIKKQRIES